MTYEDLILINNKAKNNSKFNNSIKRIHIDDRVSTLDVNCNISCNGETETIQIKELIGHISNCKCYLSNPSILSHWHFKLLDETKPLTKKKYKEIQIKKIISDNWKSYNGQIELQNPFITLYHGSRDGIIGDINASSSRDNCDFGTGFYIGSLEKQAKLLVKDSGSAKLIYKVGVDLSNLRVYRFDEKNIQEWALYIASERGKINYQDYPKLKKLVDTIRTYDVIYGLIADDEMVVAFNEFLGDSLTIDGLIYCLKKVQLGYQYVFKNNDSCKYIKYLDIHTLTNEDYDSLSVEKDKFDKEKIKVVDEAKDLYEDGLRIRGLLRRYK